MGESTAKISTATEVTSPHKPVAWALSTPWASAKLRNIIGIVVETNRIKAELATSYKIQLFSCFVILFFIIVIPS